MYYRFDNLYLGSIAMGLAKHVFPNHKSGETVQVRSANFIFWYKVP